ncbi:MAG: hypothetical protein ABIO70_09650 [Pseudomonadota bacterium]
MRADPSNPVSRLDLERWALGRLDPAAAAALVAQAREDADLGARMARVRREIEAAGDLPPLELPAEAPAPPRRRWVWAWPAFAAAAAAVVLTVAQPWRQPPSEVFRGAFDLELVQVRLGQASPQGALVRGRAGDRLQFTVVPTRAGTLQVYDLQDDGALQPIGDARPVTAGEPATGALLLDDFPGSERLYFLVTDGALEPAEVQRAVERAHARPLADLDHLPGLGEGTLQRSVLVIKEGAP